MNKIEEKENEALVQWINSLKFNSPPEVSVKKNEEFIKEVQKRFDSVLKFAVNKLDTPF